MSRTDRPVDPDLTIAAAIVNEPVTRPTNGGNKPAAQDEGGDSFAKVLDAEMDAAGDTGASAQPAPAAANVVVTKPVAAESAVEPAGVDGAEQAFKAALANTAPAAVADPTTGEMVATSPTDPAPAAQTPQTAQAAVIATLLAATPGAVATTDEAAPAEGETAEGDAAVAEGNASAMTLLVGVETPPAAPVAMTATPSATIAAPVAETAAPVGQAATAPVADADADFAPAAEADASAADAQVKQPVAGDKAAASTSAPQASAASATQVAAAVDAAAPAANTSPTPQASTTAAPVQATAEASRTAATPPALQSAPPATIQVYSRIIERADGRAQRFEVRLDPAELGRVDVRIEIGADRKVHAVLAAHDSAALSDLVRGQRALERALSGAGIDLADNGVRFELASDSGRGSANQQQTHDGNGRSSQSNVWRSFDAVSIPVSDETAAAATNNAWRPQRLDLVA